MPSISLSVSLQEEYTRLFNTCNIKTEKFPDVENIISKLSANKSRYENAVAGLKIPWYFVAVIHNMESSLNFSRHLHNGDPLTARTKQVPAGRPVDGDPPFTWEESAMDALMYKKLEQWENWSLPGILYQLEKYNGWGYRSKHPEVLSPYLWSFSNHYTRGKYIADGTWSDTAVSKQSGAAVLLRRMAEKGIIIFPGEPVIAVDDDVDKPAISFSNKVIPYGDELQKFLNRFPGIYLKEDGKPGKKTSEAFKKITGYYLKGDDRA
ncbi:MAG: hypothetical protein IPM56_16530 [Ignavibacteriales bacterium]|nr:MAG: hypothetical protein IPM56_16530 [Ignavibacteriales bacterium]